ncbi:MAG TPA: L-histidine N(alpha)-methyltransferase [Gammaproteobacteria bacterium]
MPQKNCVYVANSRKINNLIDDVREGMLTHPRYLPPKYFYDETGSRLFDQICDTPEYYPTRTEAALLDACALELMALARPDHIVEFGSGTSRKTHYLLKACERLAMECQYLPFDVCEEVLHEVRHLLESEYDWLDVLPLVGDYTAGLDHIYKPDGRCMYLFLGSSIGNFTLAQARAFVAEIKSCMKPGDTLLLGVDRVKDQDVLHAAYNDAQGLTEKFNLNVLQVLNNRLQANFDLDKFNHKAIYNKFDRRIEMYLVADASHEVDVSGLHEKLYFDKHDHILTEISHKYSQQDIENLLSACGLHILKHVEADKAWFSLILAGL